MVADIERPRFKISGPAPEYPINFTQLGKRFVLSLHHNGSNNLLFFNATKIYQFKAKNSEIKDCALCLCNISNNFGINNMKKQH